MADLGILLQYAETVKKRLIAQQQSFASNLQAVEQVWKTIKPEQLPLAAYQIPAIEKPTQGYSIIAADSSPLELSRHRAVELKAVSLARVYTDYQKGKETIERKIIDLQKDDVATLSNPLLELEFSVGAKYPAQCVLIDGSLIRWQWEQLEKATKEKLVIKYTQLLVDSYQKHSPVLAVIDRSQGRDVVDEIEKVTGQDYQGVLDEDLFGQVLMSNSFSPVFMASSPILKLDERYKVGFVYYKCAVRNAKSEVSGGNGGVIRIEFLLGQDLAEEAWGMLIDQVNKGKGYPFVIARAHDTCVVKKKDKWLLEQTLMKYGAMSQKERLKQMG